MRRLLAVLLVGGLGAVVCLVPASATVINVPGDQPTIQAGIDAAVDGDTVLVGPGSYTEAMSFSGKSIKLLSTSGPSSTFLNGPGLSTLTFDAAETRETVVEGFTLQNSLWSGSGGAVYCNPGSPTLRGNVFQDNSSYGGGAIFIASGSPLIHSNEFLRNTASENGGAIFSASGGVVQGNTFTGNYADENGGAIYTTSARLVCKSNLFRHNSCRVYGQAYIASGNSIDTLIANTFAGNGRGTSSGTVTLWYSDSVTVINNLIAFNAARGIHQNMVDYYRVDYNDVFENALGNYDGLSAGPHDISVNPWFCDTLGGDYTLEDDSPCIGAGEGGADIGAFGVGCTEPAPEQPEVLAIGVSLSGDSLHVTDHTPEFAWTFYDGQSRPHTESDIAVGNDNEWSTAEMWQPPTIESSDASIVYAGLPLEDGQTYYVRVRVRNDTLWSEWLVAPFRMNSLPTAPTPVFPDDSLAVIFDNFELVVDNAADAEGDELRYDFEVYEDSLLTQLNSYISGVIEGSGLTYWQVSPYLDENEQYWWRARVSDGYENGPWSDVWTFWVNATNSPPDPAILLAPADGELTSDLTPLFDWQEVFDPDPDATATYAIILGLDPLFQFQSQVGDVDSTSVEWPNPLTANIPYWWKVEANDGRGGTSVSEIWSFTVCDCPCHGDPTCDEVTNVLDVVNAVNVAFRGAAATTDPLCRYEQTDVSCDGVTNVIDIVKFVNVAFSGGDVAAEFCEGCGE